jgi:cytochrome c biogenesis protein CcmG, thiol:disulfide interchange protein DsbE
VARRRKQNPARPGGDRPTPPQRQVAPRRVTRRSVRPTFTWRSFAWLAGGVVVVVAAASLVIASAINHPGASLPVPSVAAGTLVRGQPPPDFTATSFDGGQLTLSSLKGHPVLVNFFASWCTQCAHELVFMEQSYQRHQAGGFTIVGVNGLETGDGVGFYHRLGLTFPAVHDPGNPGRIALAYNVTSSLPVSVFIDKTGVVDLIQLGALTPELLEQEIQKLS